MSFLLNARDKLSKTPKPLLLILSLIIIVIIGYIDYLTGPEYAFSLFYLLPISFICWIRGRLYGIISSIIAALTWYIADITSGHIYTSDFIPIWNTLVRFAFFIIITFLICIVNTMYKKLRNEAHLDFLTGLTNMRYFYDLLQNEVNRFKRYHEPFSIAYIDLDNFKKVNDNLGHLVGNELLKSITKVIISSVRSTDIMARMGGDEFALLLIKTDENQARSAINKIIKRVRLMVKKNKWPVSLSIGVVTVKRMPSSIEGIIKIADDLMYEAKENGKNGISYKIFA